MVMSYRTWPYFIIRDERHNHNVQTTRRLCIVLDSTWRYSFLRRTLSASCHDPITSQPFPNLKPYTKLGCPDFGHQIGEIRRYFHSVPVLLMVGQSQQLPDGYTAWRLRDSLRVTRQPPVIYERCVERWQSIGESLGNDVSTRQATRELKHTVAAVTRYVQYSFGRHEGCVVCQESDHSSLCKLNHDGVACVCRLEVAVQLGFFLDPVPVLLSWKCEQCHSRGSAHHATYKWNLWQICPAKSNMNIQTLSYCWDFLVDC